MFKQFLGKRVNSLPLSDVYQPVNWVTIGLDNYLSPVQRHIDILMDTDFTISTDRNGLQCNINQNAQAFIKENTYINIIC